MKWSFTGGLESNSITGPILHVGSKKEAGKKRSVPRQSMHNLQRKFDVLNHFVCFKMSYKRGDSVSPLLLPVGFTLIRLERLTQIPQLRKRPEV